jgi:hypothetical protein
MYRALPLALALSGLIACSDFDGLQPTGETVPCTPGQTQICECPESAALGEQGCDGFNKSWGPCLCDELAKDVGGDKGPDVASPVQASTPPATHVVAGARLTSPNYRLLLRLSASPATGELASESYRLRLGPLGPPDP